jgi:hypothetical protein
LMRYLFVFLLLLVKVDSLSRENFSKKAKTYNSGYSLVVTHLTTNPPVHCLSTAERTGSSIFSVLWSYMEEVLMPHEYIAGCYLDRLYL